MCRMCNIMPSMLCDGGMGYFISCKNKSHDVRTFLSLMLTCSQQDTAIH